MRDLDSVLLTKHNELIVLRLLGLLEHNRPMSCLGFELRDKTMAKIRALRRELHHGSAAESLSAAKPCACERCIGNRAEVAHGAA